MGKSVRVGSDYEYVEFAEIETGILVEIKVGRKRLAILVGADEFKERVFGLVAKETAIPAPLPLGTAPGDRPTY